jgi:hypothetical protein
VANDDEYIIAAPDPENGKTYYMGSPNALKYFGWKIVRGVDESALFYTFDQFDLIYNRPDRVLKLLFPDANSESSDAFLALTGKRIQAFYTEWQKRAARHGFKAEELEGKIEAPEVTLIDPPPYNTEVSQKKYNFSFTAKDPGNADIIGYRVYVNGVPVKTIVEKETGEMSDIIRRDDQDRYNQKYSIAALVLIFQLLMAVKTKLKSASLIQTVLNHAKKPSGLFINHQRL